MKKALMISLALGAAMIASGCDDRYRYPCQDPTNWDKAECKRPMCSATGTCPDQLLKPEDIKGDDK